MSTKSLLDREEKLAFLSRDQDQTKQGHAGAPDGHRHKGVSAGRGAIHGLVAQLLSYKALQHTQQQLLEIPLVADKALELSLERLLHAQLLRADEALQQHPATTHELFTPGSRAPGCTSNLAPFSYTASPGVREMTH